MTTKKQLQGILEIINENSKRTYALEYAFQGINLYKENPKGSIMRYGLEVYHAKTKTEMFHFLHAIRNYILAEM